MRLGLAIIMMTLMPMNVPAIHITIDVEVSVTIDVSCISQALSAK
jgi:hypothetical protein